MGATKTVSSILLAFTLACSSTTAAIRPHVIAQPATTAPVTAPSPPEKSNAPATVLVLGEVTLIDAGIAVAKLHADGSMEIGAVEKRDGGPSVTWTGGLLVKSDGTFLGAEHEVIARVTQDRMVVLTRVPKTIVITASTLRLGAEELVLHDDGRITLHGGRIDGLAFQLEGDPRAWRTMFLFLGFLILPSSVTRTT